MTTISFFKFGTIFCPLINSKQKIKNFNQRKDFRQFDLFPWKVYPLKFDFLNKRFQRIWRPIFLFIIFELTDLTSFCFVNKLIKKFLHSQKFIEYFSGQASRKSTWQRTDANKKRNSKARGKARYCWFRKCLDKEACELFHDYFQKMNHNKASTNNNISLRIPNVRR